MVKETQILITPQDVLRVRAECPECGDEVGIKVSDKNHVVDRCPNCGDSWAAKLDVRGIKRFVTELRTLVRGGQTGIRLEVIDTDGAKG